MNNSLFPIFIYLCYYSVGKILFLCVILTFWSHLIACGILSFPTRVPRDAFCIESTVLTLDCQQIPYVGKIFKMGVLVHSIRNLLLMILSNTL